MFNSVALDTCIGLIFIYLLYSLLATILLEIYAQIISSRPRQLKQAIIRMLEDDRSTLQSAQTDQKTPLQSFTDAFYAYPLIKYLGRNSDSGKPSYLTPDNFSQTVIQLLRTDNFDHTLPQMELIRNTLFPSRNPTPKDTAATLNFRIDQETLSYLRMLWINANNDISKFKSMLETWYNDTMDRASGWYKRKSQCWLMIIGIILAAIFNIDSITIAKVLSKDEKARDQLVSMAIEKYKSNNAKTPPAPSSDSDLTGLKKSLNKDLSAAQLTLGLGWSTHLEAQDYRLMPLGWIITALALSLGAPFWFDMLNKLVQLRGTGPKPNSPNSNNAVPKDRATADQGPQHKKG